MNRLTQLSSLQRGLLVLLGILAVTGVVVLLAPHPQAFLHFYYLPVLIGGYLLGRALGVLSALLCSAIVLAYAALEPAAFGPGLDLGRWYDLGIWACFLILTAAVVGSLYEARGAQLLDMRQAYAGVLEIMAKFIDSVDTFTENHSRRVADDAVEIAQAMGLREAMVEDIRVGAFLHDIGKIDVSTEVLRKAARLSPEEYAEMQTHVEKGEAIARSVGGILKHVVPMIAFHHERWDGKGYKGLVGEQIPLGARIIAVADTYDAIVTNRAYRAARSHDEALRVIEEESGKQFDPRVVSVFLATFTSPRAEREPQRRAA